MMKYLLAVVMVLGLAGTVYAAPVGLASQDLDLASDLLQEEEYGLTVAVIGDFIDERDIDIEQGSIEMDAVFARIGLSAFEKFNVYVDLGSTYDMEYSYTLTSEKYISTFEDEFIWGIGGSAVIYEWDNGLEVSALGSYRIADMNIDKVTIDGAAIAKSNMTDIKNGEYAEWQVAGELAWKMDYVTPYVGIKYSEVEADANFTYGGTARNASGKNADENLGVFVGITITPKMTDVPAMEQIAINVEGRFGDEEAINAGITYRF
ncbi:MAG: hypothetical protein ABH848_05755 [Candidatus Omnitrophota bacterium]